MPQSVDDKEVMSFEEIEARFKSQWVLIVEPDISETLEIRAGKVTCHSQDRGEISRLLEDMPSGPVAVLYIGGPSENMEFLL